MKHWTLGTKLTAWSGLVVGIGLLVCGVGAGLFIQEEQIEALDDQLRNEAHTFFGEVSRHEKELDWKQRAQVKAILPLTRTERFVEILGPDNSLLYSSKTVRDTRFGALAPGMHTLKIGKDNVRLGVFPENGLTLCLGAELNEINGDAAQLLTGFLIGLPLLVTTVAGGGWWLARKALAPVREITAAAEQITAERLSQRLPVPRTRDEVGRLTEVLNVMFDRLEKGFRQAVRFSADASHELKTPLTVLRISIEDLLESPTLLEQDQYAVASLLEQTRRLSSITESLLILARADAGRLRLDLSPIDAAEIITACVDDTRIIAEQRRITISICLSGELSALLDEARFSQILLNVLDNAVKYNRDGGKIAVAAEKTGGTVTIRIANTGSGIPPESVPQLFERFYRFDPQPGTPGHGLGLSLARELARAHGGDVELTSSDPAWTVFTIRVIASSATASRPDSAIPTTGPAPRWCGSPGHPPAAEEADQGTCRQHT